MRISAFCGLVLLLAIAGMASAGEWSKRFSVAGSPQLRVDTNDASVRVRTGDVKDVEARVTTQGWTIGPDGVRVTERQSGNRVEIDVRIPERSWSGGHRSVRIELLVPRETAAEIRTGDGSIWAEGLKGKPA